MEEQENKPTPEAPLNTEEQDFKEASSSTAEYAKFEQPEKLPNPIWKKLGIGLGVLLVLALIGGGGYWFLYIHKSTNNKSSQTQAVTSAKVTSQISATTTHYSSSNFYLAFDYPNDWVVVDNGGGIMTVTSPTMKLKTSSGEIVDGQVILSFRAKDQKLPELDGGNSVATKQSTKIAYTRPTQNQRGSTYESFLRYSGNSNTDTLDGVYVTGDSGYTLGQDIPKADIQKVDPIISITFVKCSDKTCTAKGMATSIPLSAWDDTTFSGPLEQMIKSITIT